MKFPCEWNTSILLAKHVIFVVLVFVTFPTPLETTQCKVCLFTLYWKIILEDRNLSQLFIITGFLLAFNIHWIILSLSLFFICAFFFYSYQKLSTHKHYTTQPHNTNSGEIWWHRIERKKKTTTTQREQKKYENLIKTRSREWKHNKTKKYHHHRHPHQHHQQQQPTKKNTRHTPPTHSPQLLPTHARPARGLRRHFRR